MLGVAWLLATRVPSLRSRLQATRLRSLLNTMRYSVCTMLSLRGTKQSRGSECRPLDCFVPRNDAHLTAVPMFNPLYLNDYFLNLMAVSLRYFRRVGKAIACPPIPHWVVHKSTIRCHSIRRHTSFISSSFARRLSFFIRSCCKKPNFSFRLFKIR